MTGSAPRRRVIATREGKLICYQGHEMKAKHMRIWSRLSVGVLVVCLASPWSEAQADVRLSQLFTDNMMVQRDRPVRIWGLAEPDEAVNVSLAGKQATTRPDKDGRWSVELPAMKEGENLELTVSGRNTITLRNVIVGDVWVCGGQSNMNFALKPALGSADDIKTADFPKIRHIKINSVAPSVFLEEHAPVATPWRVCSTQAAGDFTGVGFYFAREVHAKTGVPIGLLDVNRGGTAIEPWIPVEGMYRVHKPATGSMEYGVNRFVTGLPARLDATEKWLAVVRDGLKSGRVTDSDGKTNVAAPSVSTKGLDELERWIPAVRAALRNKQFVTVEGTRLPSPPKIAFANSKDNPLPQPPDIPSPPTSGSGWLGYNSCFLYNGMVHPLTRFPIKGVLWYQGESNGMQKGGDPGYQTKMIVLAEGWRKAWGQGDFPFYFVQLPPWLFPGQPPEGPAGGEYWTNVREAQLKSLSIANSGMAVTIDIGDRDIHPPNKYDVGVRLSRWALARDYGQKDLEVSGPLFRELKIEGGKARLLFDHAGKGLMIGRKKGRDPVVEDKEDKLQCFAIAGADKKWVWADAAIDGNVVVVSSPEVKDPVAVRYAYSQNPVGADLYNREGLPASPFRTDSW